jgi:hypothetical protein
MTHSLTLTSQGGAYKSNDDSGEKDGELIRQSWRGAWLVPLLAKIVRLHPERAFAATRL